MDGKKSNYLKFLSWILIFSQLNITLGCYYYTYSTEPAPSVEKLDQLKNSPNYIIVHRADQAFNLTDVRVDQQAQTIAGVLRPLSNDHNKYLGTKPFPGSANRYKKKGKDATPNVINEVHFYLKDLAPLIEGESVTISASSIEKAEVYDPDTGATTASFVFGGLGIALGVITVIGVIVFLTKSSCPFVYVNNGNEYVFAGEIYSGAIFKSIERDDYLPLPTTQADETLNLIIANKLKEQQYINQLRLLQVSHPTGTRIIPDRLGNVHHIRQPVSLISATVHEHDISTLLAGLDSARFGFNVESGKDFFNDVVVTFPKPADVNEAHLVMNAKNSLWGDYVFGEFTRLFGRSYTSWIEKQNKKAPVEKTWASDQGLAMKVFVEKNGAWEFVDRIDLVGPLAFRDLVVPLDLSDQKSQTVRIKLSAGFMLWDVDYVGMDFSADTGMTINYIQPEQALTNTGESALPSLLQADAHYLIQKTTGDEVKIAFPIESRERGGMQYDYILHSRGYYQHVRDYEGDPEITALLSFKLDGRFSRFSKEKYDEMSQLLKAAEISASIK